MITNNNIKQMITKTILTIKIEFLTQRTIKTFFNHQLNLI